MTAELLEPLTYEERCAIHIDMNTVVSRLNIFFICERIIRYCGPDPIDNTGSVEVGTIMDTETIEVHLPDRGGHFTVNLGDTWGDTREQTNAFALSVLYYIRFCELFIQVAHNLFCVTFSLYPLALSRISFLLAM